MKREIFAFEVKLNTEKRLKLLSEAKLKCVK